MTRLALNSLRHRAGAFAATAITLFLGAAIVMAFGSMLDTAGGAAVDSASEQTLVTMASVVGGWGLVIVAFAASSTLAVATRKRERELAALSAIGATRRQLTRMIVAEAGVLALVATALAVPLAYLGGSALLGVLRDTDQVASGVEYAFGPIAISVGFAVTVLGAVGGAWVAGRRITRLRAREAKLAASLDDARLSRKRKVAAFLLLALALDLAVVTATVFNGKGIDAMQTAGQASIWASIGIALLAPALVGRFATRIAAALERRGGASGYLAAHNMRRRARQMASSLMPIILFTGIATGTLYMQAIENAAPAVTGGDITAAEAKNIETLNLVVVGVIAVFAAVMLINVLISATTQRRQEFARQRLAGATPPQVVGMVGIEGAALVATGILFGSLASLATVIPFSIARTHQVIPHASILIYLGIVATAVVLTLAASVGTARRAIQAPAVEAAAA